MKPLWKSSRSSLSGGKIHPISSTPGKDPPQGQPSPGHTHLPHNPVAHLRYAASPEAVSEAQVSLDLSLDRLPVGVAV